MIHIKPYYMKLTLGQKIRKIRELKGYNQQYVAKKLCISQEYYSYIENKQKAIPHEYLFKIAELFGTSVDFINAFDSDKILCSKEFAGVATKENIDPGVNKTIITYLETITLLKENIAYLEKQVQLLMKIASISSNSSGFLSQQ